MKMKSKTKALITAGLAYAVVILLGMLLGIAMVGNASLFGKNQSVSDVIVRYDVCKAEAPAGHDCFLVPLTVPEGEMRE